MAKLREIRELAEEKAEEVTASPRDWMKYLDTAAKLYRYSFSDTLLIHAQRPDATACASLELWNGRMNRWVNRGAKGIALIEDIGPRRRLRYVFDISDTHTVRGGRTPNLWRMEDVQEEAVLARLADTYGLPAGDAPNLPAALSVVASQMADEKLDGAMDGLLQEKEGTFLEGLDEDTVRTEFRKLLVNSVFYMLSVRCGIDPMEHLEEEDFSGITDYHALPVLTFLGNAASRTAGPVLMDIGRTVRGILIEKYRETVAKEKRISYNKFSTLKRESKGAERTEGTERGGENGTDLPPERGLPVPEPDLGGTGSGDREVRDAAPDIPEGEQERMVPEHDAVGETGQASSGDRESSHGETGSADERAASDVPGTGQGKRPDGVDGAYERADGDGGGEHLTGIDVQLIEEKTEQDLSKAEEETASALSLPALPTVEQQKREIEQRMQALYAGEIAIPADVVDEVLRGGGNKDKSHLRIIYNFMIDQTPEEYTEFVRKEYKKGGIGLTIHGTDYAVWYDELGMQIAAGHTVNGQILDKAFLSWEDVSGRILQLLKQGEYAPQAVLDAARENALKEHAGVLVSMERDMAEGVAEIVFEDAEIFDIDYPKTVERVRERIAQPAYLSELVERLEGLAEAYGEDPGIMRFKLYNPPRVLAQFEKFAKEAVPFQAREGFAWEAHPVFITEDEIGAFLQGGGANADGRLSIYSFFIQDKTGKEKADFIKNSYGTGGCSHALSGADNSDASYDGKGLRLQRGGYTNPDAEILIKWPKVAERIERLIQNENYLKAADYSRMPDYEREVMAGRVVTFYSGLPGHIMRPWEGNPDIFTHRDDVVSLLRHPEGRDGLLSRMDEIIAEMPLDFENYEMRVETLADLHGYVEGTYTIFPEKKKEVQIEDGRQLSIFDFMDISVPEPGPQEPKKEKGKETGPAETRGTLWDVGAEKKTGTGTVHDAGTGKEPETAQEAEAEKKTETGKSIGIPKEPEPEPLQEEMEPEEALLIENRLFLAMEEADVYLEDFSPEQVDVIYEAAEKDLNLVPMLNPDFPPEQMQLIADISEQMAADGQTALEEEITPLTSHVMNPEEINNIRMERFLPLEPGASESPDRMGQAGIFPQTGDQTGQKPVTSVQTQQTGGQIRQTAGQIQQTTGQEPPLETAGQERTNFCITNDDLGAGCNAALYSRQKKHFIFDSINTITALSFR